MLQWIGCSEAKKKVLYHTFGDNRTEGLEQVVEAILKAGKSSSWLWKRLLLYAKKKGRRRLHESALFDFLMETTKE